MKFQITNFFLLVLLSINTIGYCQKEEKIEWSSELKLSWNDFKGKPERSNAAAVTNSGIYFQYYYNGDSIVTITIKSFFFKPTSWVKPIAKNEEVLAHEQLHFDITELYARKLRKYISDFYWRQSSPFEEKLDKHYEYFIEQLDSRQDLYDSQTSHGINSKEQLKWIEMINNEIKESDSYSDSELKIVLQ